jgi:hypothetical protein
MLGIDDIISMNVKVKLTSYRTDRSKRCETKMSDQSQFTQTAIPRK